MDTAECFRIALDWHLKNSGRGEQARLSRAAGISAPYMNHIVTGRKTGGEDIRRAISEALGMPYQDMLALGQWLIDGKDPELFLEQGGPSPVAESHS